MICKEILRAEGKPYPRTCSVHGLGPCVDFASLTGSEDEIRFRRTIRRVLALHGIVNGVVEANLVSSVKAMIVESSTSEIVELRLCEQDHIILRPDVLYRFSVDENCDECRRLRDAGSIQRSEK